MEELDLTIPVVQDVSIPELVQDLNAQFTQLWWNSDQNMPVFRQHLSPEDQARREKQLSNLLDGLIHEVKYLPQAAPEQRERFQSNLTDHGKRFALNTLGISPDGLAFIENSGLIDASLEFARQARRFDPSISGEDIYQAARNVMSMNFIQILMDLPVEVTPPVFAYSMLYPYTDNYLDDPTISAQVKRDFNKRFLLRLRGESVRPANRHEEIISELVGMIEDTFPRGRFPLVWDSLVAIHKAQASSLKLTAAGASPYEADVLGITFEKGGTSVLADGYLVAGWVSPEEAAFFYGYGAFTQLMDDLEDVDSDRKEGRLTIFSQTAPHWTLDRLTNRTIHFGRSVMGLAMLFHSPAAQSFQSLIDWGLDPIMVDIIGRAGKYYSPEYIRELEHHQPFRFGVLRKQRAKLERHKLSLGKLVEILI